MVLTSAPSSDNPIELDEDVSTVENIKTRCLGDCIQCWRSSLGSVEDASTNRLAASLPLEQPPVLDRGSPNAVPVFTSLMTNTYTPPPQEDILMEAPRNIDPTPCPQSPPPPTMIEHDGKMEREWLVDAILDSRIRRNFDTGEFYLEYKVDWRGYDASWEPLQNVLPGCEQLVEEFHVKSPKRPNLAKLTKFERKMRRKGTTRQPIERPATTGLCPRQTTDGRGQSRKSTRRGQWPGSR